MKNIVLLIVIFLVFSMFNYFISPTIAINKAHTQIITDGYPWSGFLNEEFEFHAKLDSFDNGPYDWKWKFTKDGFAGRVQYEIKKNYSEPYWNFTKKWEDIDEGLWWVTIEVKCADGTVITWPGCEDCLDNYIYLSFQGDLDCYHPMCRCINPINGLYRIYIRGQNRLGICPGGWKAEIYYDYDTEPIGKKLYSKEIKENEYIEDFYLDFKYPGKPGEVHKIILVLDSDNVIYEKDETNNEEYDNFIFIYGHSKIKNRCFQKNIFTNFKIFFSLFLVNFLK